MRAEIIFTQITLFASISFTSFYHVITLTMRTEHWNEHHRSFLCFSLLSLFAKIQYNINQLKYPDVKHDPHGPRPCLDDLQQRPPGLGFGGGLCPRYASAVGAVPNPLGHAPVRPHLRVPGRRRLGPELPPPFRKRIFRTKYR